MASYTYDFNRADGNLSSSPSSWSVPSGGTSFLVSSNQLKAANDGSHAALNVYPSALDTLSQQASLTVASVESSVFYTSTGVGLRMDPSTQSRYALTYDSKLAQLWLERATGSGSGRWVKSVSLTPGDVFKLTVVPSGGNAVLTAYINGVQVTNWDIGSQLFGWDGGSNSSGVITDSDTSIGAIPAGMYPGLAGYCDQSTHSALYDSWAASDIGGASSIGAIASYYRMLRANS
jgi:hypothetical protein